MASLSRMAPPILAVTLVVALAGCGGGGGGSSTAAESTSATAGSRPALDPDKTYDVELKTNKGAFTITLDQKQSPNATASFVALAEKGFFDGTKFHRIVPGFVIQGGDPTGTGTGGPGYSTVDTPPQDAQYTKGVVAMAKTAADPAGTAGSQFFVVT